VDERRPVKRALIAVSDKAGLLELASGLHAAGVQIVSTGGTARVIGDAGVPVTPVEEVTGFPESLDGRMKTLHPRVHAGLLADLRKPEHVAQLASLGITPFDLLVVNLYPFAATVARPGCSYGEAVENIDIGGPAMLRAAAKNHESVLVVVDPDDYALVLAALAAGGSEFELRARLATKAFAHTAAYDAMVAAYLRSQHTLAAEPFPATLPLVFEKLQQLRYGENPHQQAAFYRDRVAQGSGVASARVLQGKDLSLNNVADADTAIECVRQFEGCACVIVKHANPCGAALGASPLPAYEAAYRTDPTSAFGGIIAFNRELDAAAAAAITERQFVEVLAAPAVHPEAGRILATKPNVRVLELGDLPGGGGGALELRSVTGGLLAQSRDSADLPEQALTVPTRRQPTAQEWADLRFAWRIAKFVKSNAIVYARDGATLGVGAGQMSRVYSTRIAAMKAADAGLSVKGAVMASDAFFPFRDNLDLAAEFGIRAVIQPGGSIRDAEVIAAADQHDMAMVLTTMRHFRH